MESEIAEAGLHVDASRLKIDALNDEAWKIHITDPHKALKFAEEAKELSAAVKYEKGRAYAIRNMGVSHRYLSNLEIAVTLTIEALEALEAIHERSGAAQAKVSLGAIYYYMGNYEKALDYFLLGIKESVETGNLEAQAYGYNGAGFIYGVILSEYEKGLELLSKALQLSKETAVSEDLQPRVLDCMTEIYLKNDQIEEALRTAEECLRLTENSAQKIMKGDALFSMGRILMKQNRLAESKVYFNAGLKNSREIGYKVGNAHSLHVLGRIAIIERDFNAAENYFNDSLSIASEIKAKASIYKAHESLAELYEITGNTKLFVHHFKLFHKFRSEVFRDEQENRQKYLNIQYDLEKLKQEAEINRLTNVVMKEKNTELEKKTAELEQSYNSVSVLSKIGQEITSTLNLDTILNTVYESVNDMMDAGIFGIGIYNPDEKTIDYRLAIENGMRYQPYSRTMEDKNQFPVWCIENQKEIFISDVRNEYSNYIEEYTERDIKLEDGSQTITPISLMYLPLMIKGNVFGLLTVQSFKPDAYTSHHLDILKTLASYAAAALYNARSFETLNGTLNKLKLTQQQLVQSEKMASLGELTAGIAHEIQNPLNFINNFSEVNAEMAIELKEEIAQSSVPAKEKASILSLADSILQNQEKIVHHGKRADSIVKGMLQHSRTSTGKKEPVDINNLADEYLRLSYHGLRAKDKSFNAEIETNYDPAIDRVDVLPQDLGRVFLNLITNAFYSVTAKKKTAGPDYKPVVSVRTKKTNDTVEILISDNGTGMPQSILDKIFQPFFTTKPTGEGTGLGLSLSYDIITKGHGGRLEAESNEGEFARFNIILPA